VSWPGTRISLLLLFVCLQKPA